MTNITIDGITYIPETKINDHPYVIVRTYSAGVFAGYLESLKNKHAVMINARRLWYWSGAASLSQLSQSGTSEPGNCKFPELVQRVELTEVIEVDYCTNMAKKSIEGVPEWKE